MCIDFSHTVGAAGVERRRLPLRRLAHATEHLARARLVEPRLWRDEAHRLEQARHPDRVELGPDLPDEPSTDDEKDDYSLRRNESDMSARKNLQMT